MSSVLSYAGQIHHAIEDFVREQLRLKLQIADGKADTAKLKAMVKHWLQQMSAVAMASAAPGAPRDTQRKSKKST